MTSSCLKVWTLVQVKANATCCLLRVILQGFILNWYICEKLKIIFVVWGCYIFSGILAVSYLLSMWNNSLLLDFGRTLSRQVIYSVWTNVSPCNIPATISNKSIFLSGDRWIAFVFLYSIIIAVTVSLGISYTSDIYSSWLASVAREIYEQ